MYVPIQTGYTPKASRGRRLERGLRGKKEAIILIVTVTYLPIYIEGKIKAIFAF